MMNCHVLFRVLTLFLVGVVDIGLSFLLLYHFGQEKNNVFTYQLEHLHLTKTAVEFVLLSSLRVAIYVGVIIGLLRNSRQPLPPLVRGGLNFGVMIFATISGCYSLLKILLWNEIATNFTDVWMWLSLSFNFLFSVILLVLVFVFTQDKCFTSRTTSTSRSLTINAETGESHETEPLLNPCKDDTPKSSAKNDTQTASSPKKNVTVLRLLSMSKPDLHLLLLGFLFLIAAALADIYIPFYTGQIIDGIAISRSSSVFNQAIAMMVVFSVVSSIASGLRGFLLSLVNARLGIRVKNMLFDAILRQEIAFFDQQLTGDITSRLTTDTTTMSEALGLNVNIFLRNLIRTIGTAIFMVKLSWQMSLLTLIGLPIEIVISQYYGDYMEKLWKTIQDTLAKANNVAEEVCSTMRTVRSFSNENGEIERYRIRLKEVYAMYKKEAILYGGYIWSNELFGLGLIVSTLWYGGHLVVTGKMDAGHLVSYIIYMFQLADSIEGMGEVYTGLMQATGASAKVFEFIDRKPEIPNDGDLAPEHLEGRIEFKNVKFAYPSRPDALVLKDVSFKIEPGEIVALVGPSGGGKSSCVSLIEHFYEPVSGSVSIDGHPVGQYSHKYLHQKVSFGIRPYTYVSDQHVALVGQEPVLYARCIGENISYGLDSACSQELVESTARMANAHQFISEMKEGYRTECGEKGLQLSGGQKQRIAIARALIRNPAVLLLDEATSALDSESEHIVQQAIYSNLKGRTVLIIAHRLSTVEKADRIVVIEKGTVIEQGCHKELLRKGGLYAKLVQRQLLGFDEPYIASEQKPSRQTSRVSGSESIPAVSRSLSHEYDHIHLSVSPTKHLKN